MATSQNGWPAPPARLRTWIIPGTGRHLTLVDGPAGFLLAHLALWYSERIAPIGRGIWDEWGNAYRAVRGAVSGLSNHASGTAIDLNATQHPLGVRGTLGAAWRYALIRARLLIYRGAIAWGGDYRYRADEMHYEIAAGPRRCGRVAGRLARTRRGVRILEANPGAVAALGLTPREVRRLVRVVTR